MRKTNRTNGFLIGTLGVNPRILQYLKTVVLNLCIAGKNLISNQQLKVIFTRKQNPKKKSL